MCRSTKNMIPINQDKRKDTGCLSTDCYRLLRVKSDAWRRLSLVSRLTRQLATSTTGNREWLCVWRSVIQGGQQFGHNLGAQNLLKSEVTDLLAKEFVQMSLQKRL